MDDDDVNAPWILRERLVPSFHADLCSLYSGEYQKRCECLLMWLACDEPDKMLLHGWCDLIYPGSRYLHNHTRSSLAAVYSGCVDNGELDVA